MKKLIGGLVLGVATLSFGVAMTNTQVLAKKSANQRLVEIIQQSRQTTLHDEGLYVPNDGNVKYPYKVSKLKAKKTKSGKAIKVTGSVKVLTKAEVKKLSKKQKINYVLITTYKGDKFVKVSKHATFKTTIKAPKAKRILIAVGYFPAKKHTVLTFMSTSNDQKAKVTAYKAK